MHKYFYINKFQNSDLGKYKNKLMAIKFKASIKKSKVMLHAGNN